MFFEFPTKKDWHQLENSYAFEKLEVDEGTLCSGALRHLHF
jgi:hypothetical protein